jgi:hypothetical protein
MLDAAYWRSSERKRQLWCAMCRYAYQRAAERTFHDLFQGEVSLQGTAPHGSRK